MKDGTAFRVAGYQMAVGREVEKNADHICSAIDWAAERGAEILLTPEGSLSGYTYDLDDLTIRRSLDRIIAHAARQKVGLALGTCFVEQDGKKYDQIRFYRPDGEFLGCHNKILLCENVREKSGGEIDHFASSSLRVFLWREGLTIGGLICNDLWANPEWTSMPDCHLAQELSAMGASIIFHAVNGGRDSSPWTRLVWKYHDSNLRMRARASSTWIVTVDSAYPVDLRCSAPSGVVDPSGAFVRRTRQQGEQLFVHTISS